MTAHRLYPILQSSTYYQNNKAFQQAVSLWGTYQTSTSDDTVQRILAVAAEGLDAFVRHGDVETAFVAMLPGILEATGSPFGVLAEVIYNHQGAPHLQSHATTNIYKPGYTRYDILTNLQFYNLDTLNGAVMLEKKPVLTNDPDNDPRRGGVPMGHESIQTYLGLPFLVYEELVGALMLSNRSGGYSDADIDQLGPLCEISAWMIQAARNA